MTYENQIYGTKLTNIVVNGRFTGNRLEIEQLTAKAGDGTVQAKGFVSLASADGYPMNIAATLDNARLARSENIAARATGNLTPEKVAGQSALRRSEEHTTEIQSLMRIAYDVFSVTNTKHQNRN